MHSFSFNRYNSATMYGQRSTLAANAAAREAKTEVGMLKSEVERLMIITEALWSFIKDEHNYDDEKLLLRIQDIDLQDGKLDGRVAKQEGPKPCPQCNRPISRRHYNCIYCSAEVEIEPFER